MLSIRPSEGGSLAAATWTDDTQAKTTHDDEPTSESAVSQIISGAVTSNSCVTLSHENECFTAENRVSVPPSQHSAKHRFLLVHRNKDATIWLLKTLS